MPNPAPLTGARLKSHQLLLLRPMIWAELTTLVPEYHMIGLILQYSSTRVRTRVLEYDSMMQYEGTRVRTRVRCWRQPEIYCRCLEVAVVVVGAQVLAKLNVTEFIVVVRHVANSAPAPKEAGAPPPATTQAEVNPVCPSLCSPYMQTCSVAVPW